MWSDGQQCHQVGHDWNCAYPPSMLENAMNGMTGHGTHDSGRHNEIVIDTRSIDANLPSVILGFFCLVHKDCSSPRQMRTGFIAAYGLSGSDVPLLEINLRASGYGADKVFKQLA